MLVQGYCRAPGWRGGWSQCVMTQASPFGRRCCASSGLSTALHVLSGCRSAAPGCQHVRARRRPAAGMPRGGGGHARTCVAISVAVRQAASPNKQACNQASPAPRSRRRCCRRGRWWRRWWRHPQRPQRAGRSTSAAHTAPPAEKGPGQGFYIAAFMPLVGEACCRARGVEHAVCRPACEEKAPALRGM